MGRYYMFLVVLAGACWSVVRRRQAGASLTRLYLGKVFRRFNGGSKLRSKCEGGAYKADVRFQERVPVKSRFRQVPETLFDGSG